MRKSRALVSAGIVSSICTLLSTQPAQAFNFSLGELQAQLDSTVSIGGSYRLDDPDPSLYSITKGGLQYSNNGDEGNLNYLKGWSSLAVKMTNELLIQDDNYGFFFRTSAFYDYENEDNDRAFNPLSDRALANVGSDFDILDAYFYYQFDWGEVPMDFRFGNQVISWGESTFIQNGINSVNPIDVSKIRIPGAELREALTPVPIASLSAGLTEFISLDVFYQMKWEETVIDPPGTYFSTNDFVGEDGKYVWLGFGAIPETYPVGFIPRGPDAYADDSGQFGVAMRIYAPDLNDTEFGFYFMRYNSRLPLISARTPTVPINTDLTSPLTTVFAMNGMSSDAALAQAQGIWALVTALNTYGPEALTATQLATLQSEPVQAALDGAQQIALLTSAATANYLIEYPEDINLFGASFNTMLGSTGWALQGELSYRPDQPVQYDDVELLFAALSSIYPVYGNFNQLGNYAGQLNTRISGWTTEDMYQMQMTATKVFGPILGADQWIFLTEVGATWFPDLGDSGIRFEGPGTYTSGNAAATAAGLQPATEDASAFATGTSWGYRAVARLDYSNLWFGVNASPSIQFAHDVAGITPQPIGNFLEDRKSMTLGVEFTYQNAWSTNLRYTRYWGAGRHNLINDRDFISTTLKYSF